ncbi:MAG: hypothetical protein IJY89_03555 [Clostridia bacterium]|nr:hypothetical protein [Clostridia bacterium]
MSKEKFEKMLERARERITPQGLLRLYGAVCALLFTYTLLYLQTRGEYGAYSALQEEVAALLEHGLMVALLGLCGFVLVEILKREEHR